MMFGIVRGLFYFMGNVIEIIWFGDFIFVYF